MITKTKNRSTGLEDKKNQTITTAEYTFPAHEKTLSKINLTSRVAWAAVGANLILISMYVFSTIIPTGIAIASAIVSTVIASFPFIVHSGQ